MAWVNTTIYQKFFKKILICEKKKKILTSYAMKSTRFYGRKRKLPKEKAASLNIMKSKGKFNHKQQL